MTWNDRTWFVPFAGRRSIRLRGYDYARPGAYFVTIRADPIAPPFSRVRGGAVHLTDAGRIVDACWHAIPNHFPHVRRDAYVIMPNHIHGVLVLTNRASVDHAVGRIAPGSLGAIVRSFKSAATASIRHLDGMSGHRIWQRNYFERIVRTPAAMRHVRRYIVTNPMRWNRGATQ